MFCWVWKPVSTGCATRAPTEFPNGIGPAFWVAGGGVLYPSVSTVFSTSGGAVGDEPLSVPVRSSAQTSSDVFAGQVAVGFDEVLRVWRLRALCRVGGRQAETAERVRLRRHGVEEHRRRRPAVGGRDEPALGRREEIGTVVGGLPELVDVEVEAVVVGPDHVEVTGARTVRRIDEPGAGREREDRVAAQPVGLPTDQAGSERHRN